jgi:hypothetical protein
MGRGASHLPTWRRVRRMLHALVLSRTWAFRSRSPRAVWKWLSQRIGTEARILAALDAYEASDKFMSDATALANAVIDEEDRASKARNQGEVI